MSSFYPVYRDRTQLPMPTFTEQRSPQSYKGNSVEQLTLVACWDIDLNETGYQTMVMIRGIVQLVILFAVVAVLYGLTLH